MPLPDYEQLVFSGGGTRCYWHGGFMDAVMKRQTLKPARVTAVSGGALSAVAFIGGREEKLRDTMLRVFGSIDRNVRWHEVGTAETLTPHQKVYRRIVEETVNDDAEQRIAEGPQFHIQIGHPPADAIPTWSTAALFPLYEAEMAIRGTPHLDWSEKAGLTAELVDARQAAREGRIVDLVCAAAVIPPIFGIAMWEGRQVVDSGMADKAPMPPGDAGETLILLTRSFRNVPEIEGRTYVWPSEETPADKIDFTDPDKLERTWELGQRDGKTFLERVAG